MDPASRTQRARVAALIRHRPDDPDTLDAAASFRRERWEARVRQVVDEAPPLTNEQRDRLAALLQGGSTR